jgi:hypothetical protein
VPVLAIQLTGDRPPACVSQPSAGSLAGDIVRTVTRGTPRMNLLRLLQDTPQPEADLTRVYDAIVIGSGAAGGMAAHVLTSHGMKFLMLEAGKRLDIDK